MGGGCAICPSLRTTKYAPPHWQVFQGAARGGQQKQFDHFFFVFGTLSVAFWSLFLMFLPLFRHLSGQTLLPDSFCGRVKFCTCNVDRRFCGGGAWTLLSDVK